jgi:hypothetical protein
LLNVDPKKSRVVIETQASGLLAAVAHDLRILALAEDGSSEDGESCVTRFLVAKMRVEESRRHGTREWHAPSPSDAKDIEGRIERELFAGCPEVSVRGKLRGDEASITVRAQREQTVFTPIRVDRSESGARAAGQCVLSLRALGTGKVRVPLGAIQLADEVVVRFDLVFVS